jgi:hypothetical protein
MRRIVALASSLAIVSLVAIVPAAGATAVHVRATADSKRITGKWTGAIEGSGGQPQQITVDVSTGERKGTWSLSASCHGTLALKNISNGFHHYNRIAAAGATCSGANGSGVDCLKREGSKVLDEYVPAEGTTWRSGLLTRAH